MSTKNGIVDWRRGEEPQAPRDYVLFTMAGRFTHADVIRKIAERLKLRLEPLPQQLSEYAYDYPENNPRVFDGSAGAYMDWITAHHENLQWGFSDGTLRVRIGAKRLSRFDEAAGRLACEVQRGENGRITEEAYQRICIELHRMGFKPANHLEGDWREELRAWNKACSPGEEVRTFADAYKHRELKRGVQRLLSRAKTKYEKAHPAA